MSAPFRPLAVTGTAALTALGADVEQTCTSLRAGLRGQRRHAFYRGAVLDPDEDPTEPLTAVPVRSIDPRLPGPARLLALLVPVLSELAVSTRLRRAELSSTALLVALPEPDAAVDAWQLAGTFVPALCQRAGLELRVTRVSQAGRAGGIALLAEAAALLASREVDRIILAGVDSYLSRDRLEALDARCRLKSPRGVDGFIPGEAASALLLETPRHAEARRAPVLCTLAGLGLGDEPETLRGDRCSSGRGLTAALRAAAPEGARWVLCDLNGESYRAFEWGVVQARVGLGDVGRLVLPALGLGDVGAATFGVLASSVAAAFARGYAPADEALVWAASDGPLRGAARLTRA